MLQFSGVLPPALDNAGRPIHVSVASTGVSPFPSSLFHSHSPSLIFLRALSLSLSVCLISSHSFSLSLYQSWRDFDKSFVLDEREKTTFDYRGGHWRARKERERFRIGRKDERTRKCALPPLSRNFPRRNGETE